MEVKEQMWWLIDIIDQTDTIDTLVLLKRLVKTDLDEGIVLAGVLEWIDITDLVDGISVIHLMKRLMRFMTCMVERIDVTDVVLVVVKMVGVVDGTEVYLCNIMMIILQEKCRKNY